MADRQELERRTDLGRNGFSKRRRVLRGFTVIELMVSMAIFIIGVLAYARVVASSGMATRVARETTLARETAYRIVETMRAQNFSQVYRLYNSTTADDPGPGAAPGANF